MSRVDRAEQIKVLIENAVTELGNVTVTLKSAEVEDLLFHGPVVLIQPPKMTFSTFTIVDAVWDLYVISGPVDDRMESWRLMDGVIDKMEFAHLPLDRAEPANFQPMQGPAVPAYYITWPETLMVTP